MKCHLRTIHRSRTYLNYKSSRKSWNHSGRRSEKQCSRDIRFYQRKLNLNQKSEEQCNELCSIDFGAGTDLRNPCIGNLYNIQNSGFSRSDRRCSFPLGAAVTALMITKGANPYLTLPAAFAAGVAAGICTGLDPCQMQGKRICFQVSL